MRYSAYLLAMVVMVFAATDSRAASVSLRAERYEVTAGMVSSGAPAGALINDFYVTSDADILAIGSVDITGVELYNIPPPFGTDSVPYMPCFVCFRDENLYYPDSWISTPGNTSVLGGGFPGMGTATWGDLSNDGPQHNFLFARLTTLPGKTGLFEGRVTVAGSTGPENFPFSFPIGVPEPGCLALFGVGLGIVCSWRR